MSEGESMQGEVTFTPQQVQAEVSAREAIERQFLSSDRNLVKPNTEFYLANSGGKPGMEGLYRLKGYEIREGRLFAKFVDANQGSLTQVYPADTVMDRVRGGDGSRMYFAVDLKDTSTEEDKSGWEYRGRVSPGDKAYDANIPKATLVKAEGRSDGSTYKTRTVAVTELNVPNTAAEAADSPEKHLLQPGTEFSFKRFPSDTKSTDAKFIGYHWNTDRLAARYAINGEERESVANVDDLKLSAQDKNGTPLLFSVNVQRSSGGVENDWVYQGVTDIQSKTGESRTEKEVLVEKKVLNSRGEVDELTKSISIPDFIKLNIPQS